MNDSRGVEIVVERRLVPRRAQHEPISCIECARPFLLSPVQIAIFACGERLGFVCRDCLAPDAQARFDEEVRLQMKVH